MSADLPERVESLRAWCERRIAQCRREEHKFDVRSTVTLEAVTERLALSAVLEMLGYEVPPRDEADLRGRGDAARARALTTRRPRRRHGYEPDGAGGCVVCGESADEAMRPGGCAAKRDSHSAPDARGEDGGR